MRTNSILTFILSSMMTAACGITDNPIGQVENEVTGVQEKEVIKNSQSGQCNSDSRSEMGFDLGKEVSKALEYSPLTNLQQALAVKEAGFSFDLFKAVSKSDVNNVAVSTFGLFTNLSMLAAGVTGDTYAEIVSSMGLVGFTKEEVAAYCNAIAADLEALDNNVAFVSSNSFWYDSENVHPVSSFVSMIGDDYRAGTYQLDNRSLTPSEPVNVWASQKSQGMIPQVVDREKQYKWLLANVTYFEGVWTSDKYGTEPMQFTDIACEKSEKDFFGPKSFQEMKGFNLDYESVNLPSVLWIPYGNGAFSMALILPPAGVGLDEFIAGLTADTFATYSANARMEEKVMFRIPVFGNAYTIDRKTAVQTFNALGIYRVFEEHGEFGGMLEDKDVCLDEVVMSSQIMVNEKGTKAAGASVIGQGFAADLPKTHSFTADRPFVYAIVDIHNTVLFMGTVTK